MAAHANDFETAPEKTPGDTFVVSPPFFDGETTTVEIIATGEDFNPFEAIEAAFDEIKPLLDS